MVVFSQRTTESMPDLSESDEKHLLNVDNSGLPGRSVGLDGFGRTLPVVGSGTGGQSSGDECGGADRFV